MYLLAVATDYEQEPTRCLASPKQDRSLLETPLTTGLAKLACFIGDLVPGGCLGKRGGILHVFEKLVLRKRSERSTPVLSKLPALCEPLNCATQTLGTSA